MNMLIGIGKLSYGIVNCFLFVFGFLLFFSYSNLSNSPKMVYSYLSNSPKTVSCVFCTPFKQNSCCESMAIRKHQFESPYNGRFTSD